MGKLDGKVAIVTGAAQGIGAEYAKRLASEGAKVMCADVRDAARTVGDIAKAGGTAQACKTDVSQTKDTQALVQTAR